MANPDPSAYASKEQIEELNFPVYERDWSAAEELRLLDAVEKHGWGNWKCVPAAFRLDSHQAHPHRYRACRREIAADVGTKKEIRCQRHYLAVYLESPMAPLPDPRATLLEYGEEGSDSAVDTGSLPSLPVAEELAAVAASVPQEWVVPPPSAPHFIIDTVRAGTLDGGEASIYLDADDPANVGGDLPDEDAANTCDMAGYSPLRGDFDVEHANDAEQVIADIEFSPGESPASVELKLKVLEIYNAQLDERARRKAFLLQRGLLNYRKALITERRRPREEREIRAQLRPLARFMSPAEHEEVVSGLILEDRLRKRIANLQELRANGVRTLEAGHEYELAKRSRRESATIRAQQEHLGVLYAGVPASSDASRPAAPAGEEGATSGRGRGRGAARAEAPVPAGALPTSAMLGESADISKVQPAVAVALSGAPGADTLSPDEAALCQHLQLLPSQYHAIRDAVLMASRRAQLQGSEGRAEAVRVGQSAGQTKGVPPPLSSVVVDFVVSCGWVDAANVWGEGPVVAAPELMPANVAAAGSAPPPAAAKQE